MKDYLLLVSINVFDYIEDLPRLQKLEVKKAVVAIGRAPLQYSDFTEYDVTGRLIHISVTGDHSLNYWIDDADCHIKILEIHSADY